MVRRGATSARRRLADAYAVATRPARARDDLNRRGGGGIALANRRRDPCRRVRRRDARAREENRLGEQRAARGREAFRFRKEAGAFEDGAMEAAAQSAVASATSPARYRRRGGRARTSSRGPVGLRRCGEGRPEGVRKRAGRRAACLRDLRASAFENSAPSPHGGGGARDLRLAFRGDAEARRRSPRRCLGCRGCRRSGSDRSCADRGVSRARCSVRADGGFGPPRLRRARSRARPR